MDTPKAQFLFAVKRGPCLTLFEHATSAYRYWRACLGSVLLYRNRKGSLGNPFSLFK